MPKMKSHSGAKKRFRKTASGKFKHAHPGQRHLMAPLDGKLVLFGFTLAVFYHLGNGIRHLVWDSGLGFSPRTATASGAAVIGFAIVATLAVWGLAIVTGGFQ